MYIIFKNYSPKEVIYLLISFIRDTPHTCTPNRQKDNFKEDQSVLISDNLFLRTTYFTKPSFLWDNSNPPFFEKNQKLKDLSL